MTFPSFLRQLISMTKFGGFKEPRRRFRRQSNPLLAEALEDRTVPSQIYAAIPANLITPAPGGIVQVDSITGQETTVWQGGALGPYDGAYDIAVDPSGILFFRGRIGNQLGVLEIDPTAPNPTPTMLDASFLINDVAVSPSGAIYGAIAGLFAPGGIVQIDRITGQETTIWQAPLNFEGAYTITAESDGVLLFRGRLGANIGAFELDPAAPNATPTMLDPNGQLDDLAVGPDGTIYGSVPQFSGPGSIVKIDQTTGQETTVWQGAASSLDNAYNLAVEDSGAVLFRGRVANQFGVYRLNPADLNPTPTLLDANSQISDLAVGAPSDTTPPVLSATTATPLLWPANGKMVAVQVTGTITDNQSGLGPTASYTVIDSYGQVQPSGTFVINPDGSFSFNVSLQAKRNGQDKEGRIYTILISAYDQAGNLGTITLTITVPHDQGEG